MKTTLHTYRFDLTKPFDKAQYDQFCKDRQAKGSECFKKGSECFKKGSECFKALGMYYSNFNVLDGQSIELDSHYIFSNQWNTLPIPGVSELGLRVFDWAEEYLPNAPTLRQGHWLEQTSRMKSIRHNTRVCGYCGHQSIVPHTTTFCDQCLDSEYLKESDLSLLRLIPVEQHYPKREPLSDSEQATLLPKFLQAQIHGSTERGKERLQKLRASIISKAEKTIEDARTEHNGLLWLLDRGVSLDNVIYYSHSHKFCFGWRKPLGAFEAQALESTLKRIMFDFDYEFVKE